MEIALVVFGVVLAGVLVWCTLLTQRSIRQDERIGALEADAAKRREEDERIEKARAAMAAIRKRRSARRA